MKKVIYTGVTLLIGSLFLGSVAYADSTDGREGVTSEKRTVMVERKASMQAYHAARLAAKEEKFRASLEAQGINPDSLIDTNRAASKE